MLLAGPEARQLPLRHNRSLPAAVTGITAAVVGVIANLAAYFAVHTLFSATRTVDAGPIQGRFPTSQAFRWRRWSSWRWPGG